MIEDRPNYYAIIPAHVRYDNELKANEKLLFGEITALCDRLGYCWSTNEYFANLYNVSKETISRWINHLIKKGYLFSEMIYKENSGEILNRILKLNKDSKIDISNFYRKRNIFPIDDFDNTVLTKKSIDYCQKNQESIDEKVKENNTSINNKKKIYKRKFEPPTLEEIKKYCLERKNNVDAQKFYDYYSVSEWKDKDGKPVRSWKQKVITWEGGNLNKPTEVVVKNNHQLGDIIEKNGHTYLVTKDGEVLYDK